MLDQSEDCSNVDALEQSRGAKVLTTCDADALGARGSSSAVTNVGITFLGRPPPLAA